MNYKAHLICNLALFLILTFTPFMLFYFIGYTKNLEWNLNSNISDTIVTNPQMDPKMCDTGGGGGGDKRRQLAQCYEGSVTVSCLNNKKTFVVAFGNAGEVEKVLNNFITKCWYQIDNPPDFEIEPKSVIVYLVISLIILITGTIISIIWGTWAIVNKNKLGYQTL